uniref:Peptidase S1 domain-containing protein n=1 Tax=Caenorhabditis japonica TaxID=281687 RepID=A0A8R1HRG3_CAEJA
MRGHDWAIVEVEKRISFGSDVTPICLPKTGMYYTKLLTVPGWGRSYSTVHNSRQSKIRISVFNESGPLIHEIPMRVDRQCRRPWSDKLPSDADDYICAKSMDTSNYSAPRTCHGDSGGGLEYRDDFGRAFLIAITSFGTRGCPSNMLARFTRVDAYLELICKYTGVCY